MSKQGDIDQVRNEMIKLSRVIEQYNVTGYIYYHDIQILKKINKESSILFSALLLISILLGITTFYLGMDEWVMAEWAMAMHGMVFTLYLMFQIERLVSIKNLPSTQYKESWDNVEVELKQLRESKDLDSRVNRYQKLQEEVTHALKQADELGLEHESNIIDILKGFTKLNDELNDKLIGGGR